MNDKAYNDLMGLHDPNRGESGLKARCSRCGAPSVTNQKGYQRCEQCWDDDATEVEAWRLCKHGEREAHDVRQTAGPGGMVRTLRCAGGEML